jgi:glutamine synthetase
VTGERYWRDPRHVAQKAEAYLQESGIADTAYFGPEVEFFIFDSVRYDQNEHCGYYFIDSEEGAWNSGREGKNLGHRPRYKEGYFPAPPTDTLQDLRSIAILKMMEAGIDIEVHHHEVATAGQGEIDMRYQTLTRMADQVMLYKYILRNVAREHDKTVTFMPKPLFGDNGSGMHVHVSLWKNGQNLFYDPEGYAQLSLLGMYFIGGLLRHAPALCALVAPTTNSYRRLVPGFEAPVNLVYSQRNRSAAVRIPVYSRSAGAKRIEFRTPDPSCNPYLAFAAILMAGLDGIIKGWTWVIHWTPTSTSCRRQSWLGCGRCLAAWTRRCGSWRPTTSSCCGAGFSPQTCWVRGWSTKGDARWTPYGCAPIPTSSTFTTTYRGNTTPCGSARGRCRPIPQP